MAQEAPLLFVNGSLAALRFVAEIAQQPGGQDPQGGEGQCDKQRHRVMQYGEKQQCQPGHRVDPHGAIEVFQRDLLAVFGLIVAGPLLQIAFSDQ
ncbi:hypothetical protein D3C81_958980 [compost metagenome]